MVEVRHVGATLGDEVTDEQTGRIMDITKPLAEALLGLSSQDLYNVMGSLLMSFGLRYDDPVGVVSHLTRYVLEKIPEAMENARKIEGG